MPVTGPYRTFATSERSADDRIPVRAVRLAAVVHRKCCDKGPILVWGSASARGMETARQHGYIPSEDRDRGANPLLRS
jgi:hypothetical protein